MLSKRIPKNTIKKLCWIISLNLLIVLLVFLYVNGAFTNISQSLQQNVIDHQESYIKDYLQQEILYYLNRGNYTLLEEFIDDYVSANPLLEYVILTHGQRRIMASDVGDNLHELEKYLDAPDFRNPGTQLIFLDGDPVINSTSIIPGMRRLQFGVRAFDSDAAVNAEVPPVLSRVFIVISLGMLLSIALTVLVGTSTHINNNNRRARSDKAREGRLSKVFELDELDQLGQIFNDMMASLDSNWQENARLQQQLNDREFIRSQYLKRVIAAQEDERKRISRELHDQTSQSLTSLMLGLKAIQEAETLADVKQYTQEYRSLIACSLEEIQNLAFELRPSSLDDLGLVPALKRYVQEISRRKDIDIDFHWKDYSRSILREEEETIVYRVVQESLTNIIKHAAAKKVKIRLRVRQEKFVVYIKDDGRGFDADAIKDKDPDSLGIYGMKERARLAGGRLYIRSRKNRGTMVMLVLPLTNKGVV